MKFVLFLLLLFQFPHSLVCAGDNVAVSEAYQKLRDHLCGIIQAEIKGKGIPCLSIAVVSGKEIVWAEGFGFSDAERTQPATARTVYRVGSVSKLLTDLAILQCVEQGQVNLDAPLTDYDPDFAPANVFGVPITLRQLASHRAGLVREPPVGNYFDPTEPSLLATVRSLNQTKLVYQPSTRTKYSNAGVAVVGHVLSEVTQQRFEKVIWENVLQPLGMTDSRFALNNSLRERLADAQMWTHDGRKFAAPTFELGTSPAGNLYSTVIDLSKFAVALFNEGRGERGQLLTSESLQEAMKPQSDESDGFGIGFHISEFQGQKLVGHGGAVYGFSTQFYALPESDLAVICVAAKDLTNGVVRRVARHALSGALQIDQEEFAVFPTTTAIPISRARLLDGTYLREGSDQRVELRESNGRLSMIGLELQREIRAQGSDLVADDVFGFGPRLERIDDDTWKMNRQFYRRVENNDAPARLPSRWVRLVGEYGWDHNTLFIYERHGELWCLIEWAFHYPLKEIPADADSATRRFRFPDYGLYQDEEVVFAVDQRGDVLQVIAAEVTFERGLVGRVDGETFRITPRQPIAKVREVATNATMPAKLRQANRKPDLVDVTSLDSSIKLDIRYASNNNFMNAAFYKQPRAFLQRPAAKALVAAHLWLKDKGYGLLIHDAYRPWFVTKMFWEATPSHQKIFVANPANGSRHNRGCAVDLTLYNLSNGLPVPMGAGYDEFSPRSFPDYPVADSRARWHRELLRDAMEQAGFTIYKFEWWHFDYGDWREYPVLNQSFEQILP